MSETEHKFFEVRYLSCEENRRWCIIRCPFDWEESDVKDNFPIGGYGDDPAEITEIIETYNDDYQYDFTN